MRKPLTAAAILLVMTALLARDARPLESQRVGATGTITVDLSAPGARIPPTLYGIFFEEINHAGDGGLYAELVRNRGFEDANLPPACLLDNGFIVPPRTPHFDTGKPNNWRLRWDVTDPHPNWTLEATGGAEATIALTTDSPLNDATPHSMVIEVTKPASAGGRVAVINDGYWGMSVTTGAEYVVSFFARTEPTYRGTFVAALEGPGGAVVGRADFNESAGQGPAGGWRRFRGSLRATGTEARARLVLTMPSAGRVWLDMVSLFPAKTFKDRPNGLRPDLAQMVADDGVILVH